MNTFWIRRQYALLMLPALTMAAGCDDITTLKQEDPSQILASTVYAPQNAALLVNGAIGDF